MSITRKLTFGIFYLISSSLASLLINVATVGIIARKLGVENFGLYSAILSFVGLFQFLSDFGLNKTLLKFGSKDRTKTQTSFGNALLLKGILVLPLFFLATIFGFFAGYRNLELIILELFCLTLVLDSYGTVFSSIRRILGSFKLISFFRVVKTLINLFIVYIALSIQSSVFYLAIATTALSFFIFIVSLINTIFLMKPKLDLKVFREFFQDSIVFGLNDFFLNIYMKISVVLLSFFNDLHSVGIYSVAIRFTNIANLLPKQVRFALLPTMYRLLEDKKNNEKEVSIDIDEKSKKVFSMLLKYMSVLSAILVILIFYFSDSIIHLVFGTKYDLSIPLVKLFSIFIYLRFIGNPFSLFFLGLNKHKNMVIMQGFATILLVALNIVLIPKYSVYGACLATILSELSFQSLLISSGLVFKIWNVHQILRLLFMPLLSGFLSLWLTMTFLSSLNIFFQLVLIVIFYLTFLLMTKQFDKNDKELFGKIFSRVK